MKSKLHLLLLVMISISFTGCLVGKGQPKSINIDKSNSLPDKEITLNFPEIDPITGRNLEFNFDDLYSRKNHVKTNFGFGVVTDNFNQYALTKQLTELSKYDQYHKISGGRLPSYAGLKIEFHKNAFNLMYSNGEYNNGHRYIDEVRYLLQYKQIDRNTIKFLYPTHLVHRPYKTIIGTDIDMLDSFENIDKDFKHVYNNLDKIIVTMYMNNNIKNEVNSPYSANAIYANFDRILGKFDWNKKDVKTTNLKKENTFSYNYKKKTYPIHIEVFPYRNGSKVVYTVPIDYSIQSNGITSITHADVVSIQKEIQKIVNN